MKRNYIVAKCQMTREYKDYVDLIVSKSLNTFFKALPPSYKKEYFEVNYSFSSNTIYLKLVIADETVYNEIHKCRTKLETVLGDEMKSHYLLARSEVVFKHSLKVKEEVDERFKKISSYMKEIK